MTYYLLHLGEFWLTDSDSHHYKWSDLYKGSYDECLRQFYEEMVGIFSQYGENWGDLQLSDIECRQLSKFELTTDGNLLHLDVIRDTNKCRQCKLHCHPDQPILISYGTSGGLHLSFSALVISDKTDIRFDLSHY